jgi:hypothetical protein
MEYPKQSILYQDADLTQTESFDMTIAYLDRSNGETVLLEMRMADENARPFVTVAGRRYDTMAALVGDCPELTAQERLPLYCALSMHLSRGPGYMLIADPDAFRTRYQALVSRGSGDVPTAADFGPFNLTELASPAVTADTLVFYAEDSLYNVPYRVEVPWPADAKRPVRFLLLPLDD